MLGVALQPHPAGVEACTRSARDERPGRLVRLLREVRGRLHAHEVGVPNVERTGGVGPAQPFLRGDRVEIELADFDFDRAGRLRAVDEERQAALAPHASDVEPPPRRPHDV